MVGVEELAKKKRGSRSLPKSFENHVMAAEPEETTLTAKDATRAISARDAPSLAVFFRNLFDPTASRAGPQHVCLKRAFALLESRWSLDAEEGAYQLPTTGHHEPHIPFGESFLSPEVFVSVVAFLDVPQTMQSARTSKAWWRNVSALPASAHVDLTTLRPRSPIYRTSLWGGPSIARPRGLKWNDVLIHLRHIKNTNPRKAVRRLTFNSSTKLGSLSNLSSATTGLLTHIDFSRSRREVDFDQLGMQLPGLRGLAVQSLSYYTAARDQAWTKSLAKLISTVSLESLRLRHTGLDDSSLAVLAEAGDSLLRCTFSGGSADIEEGMAVLGAAAPRLETLAAHHVRVTNRGWEKFGKARLASKRHLVSVHITPASDAHVPSKATRAVLLRAVTKSLVFSLGGRTSSGGSSNSSSDAPASQPVLIDCQGSKVGAAEAPGKLQFDSASNYWGSWKATDL
ncbi:unnamed protein product [Ectocarpus sp. 12 AP-2014]